MTYFHSCKTSNKIFIWHPDYKQKQIKKKGVEADNIIWISTHYRLLFKYNFYKSKYYCSTQYRLCKKIYFVLPKCCCRHHLMIRKCLIAMWSSGQLLITTIVDFSWRTSMSQKIIMNFGSLEINSPLFLDSPIMHTRIPTGSNPKDMALELHLQSQSVCNSTWTSFNSVGDTCLTLDDVGPHRQLLLTRNSGTYYNVSHQSKSPQNPFLKTFTGKVVEIGWDKTGKVFSIPVKTND